MLDEPEVSDDEVIVRTDQVRFGKVPEWVMYHKELTVTDVGVYLVLERHTGLKGSCWPGLERLGELIGLSLPTVRKAMTRLQAVGAVSVKRRGQGLTNLYHVHWNGPGSVRTAHPDQSRMNDLDRKKTAHLDANPVVGERESVNEREDLGEAHASQAATPGSLEQGVSPRAKKPKPEGQGRGGTEEARKATALAREFIDKRRAHGGVIPLGGFAAVRERMQDCYEAGWPEDEIRAVFRAAKVFSRAALEMERTKLWPSAKSDVEQRELRAGESIGVTEADHDAYWAEEERRRAMTREERDAEDAARFALWCAKHPEEVAANKAWRATHPEAEAVWRESNPDAE